MTATAHPYKFFKAGGFDQVSFSSGAEIANLEKLDQKLWVALACPSSGLVFDSVTLAQIDSDKDGRIRAPEIIAACQWTTGLLKNPDTLLKGSEALALSDINDSCPDGAAILASAKHILQALGKAEALVISLEDIQAVEKVFAQTLFNGDGIIPAECSEDEGNINVIKDIIHCIGAETDRSGKPGVNLTKVEQFYTDLEAYSSWWALHEQDPKNILPLGSQTEAAFGALNAVKSKVNDYFSRCRLASFDERALLALNRQESEYLELASKDLSISASEVAGFPISKVEADKPLGLKSGINPAWLAAIQTFVTLVVEPLLGSKSTLSESEWTKLCATFAPFEGWSTSKTGGSVESLGLDRIRAILAGNHKEHITELIAKDQALATEFNSLVMVEKLVRYNRYLVKLLTNFVSFRDFYGKSEKAIFQAGTLFLDSRSCELCIQVQDAAKHAKMAALAGSYIAYCDCSRSGTGEKMQIAAIFTNGDSENLMVGRNGIFYDRKGDDWDATISKIIDNPISIRQSFWSPYKKLIRMIEEMAAKRAAEADAASDAKLKGAATATVNVDKSPLPPKKVDVGTVAAISVAIAGIGGLITGIIGQLTGLLSLPFWQFCIAAAGLLLLISGPSMIIAWLKLRKRNLGPLLDANGWAINAKATINVPFGATLTQVAVLPKGSKAGADDQFGEKGNTWIGLLKVVLVISFFFSLLNHFCIWDTLIFNSTGKHYPQFFKVAASLPESGNPKIILETVK
jgi:hypothetical protein